jgi:hypothetical protein
MAALTAAITRRKEQNPMKNAYQEIARIDARVGFYLGESLTKRV